MPAPVLPATVSAGALPAARPRWRPDGLRRRPARTPRDAGWHPRPPTGATSPGWRDAPFQTAWSALLPGWRAARGPVRRRHRPGFQIGRASCREGMWLEGGGGLLYS